MFFVGVTEMGKKILLVESDRNYLQILIEYVEKMEIFSEYRIASEGLKAAEIAMEFQPDIVVTSIVLSGIDGFGLIGMLKKKLSNTVFVISSALKTDFAVKQAGEIGAQLYFTKPTNYTVFCERLTQLLENMDPGRNFVIQREDSAILLLITREIQKIGFPSNVKGFQYVRHAIYLMMENERPKSMMHEIYPAVAEKFGTTPSCVERNIRHGIENAWIHGSVSYIDEVFGFTVDADKGKPTNTAFIMTVAERIRLRI